MLVTAFLDPLTRTVVWTLALVWMGGACLANARRCSRTHCRFTGPFFLVVAVLVVATLPVRFHSAPTGGRSWVSWRQLGMRLSGG